MAHDYLDALASSGPGIEIGGSAHNPFGIKNCKNVDYSNDMGTIFKDEEERLCGERLPVDVVDEGDTLATFPDSSLHFIISSHVFEHFPNPLKALESWRRVLVPGGRFLATIPHTWATEADSRRRPSGPEDFARARREGWGWDSAPLAEGHGRRGHYHAYTPGTFLALLRMFPDECGGLPFRLVALAEVDDKVGNGFTVVCEKQ